MGGRFDKPLEDISRSISPPQTYPWICSCSAPEVKQELKAAQRSASQPGKTDCDDGTERRPAVPQPGFCQISQPDGGEYIVQHSRIPLPGSFHSRMITTLGTTLRKGNAVLTDIVFSWISPHTAALPQQREGQDNEDIRSCDPEAVHQGFGKSDITECRYVIIQPTKAFNVGPVPVKRDFMIAIQKEYT